MPVLVVANPKGGVGKSTLATHVAGYWAHRGHAVMLGDIDRQQSARQWLTRRPASLPRIRGWEVDRDDVVRPPKGTTHVVLDTPAGLHGKRLRQVLKRVDWMLVPLAPGVFDREATAAFVDALTEWRLAGRTRLGLVGMRTDERTLAAGEMRDFVRRLNVPLLTTLRPTQNYLHLAARGLTLFDMPAARVARDLAQWQPLCEWLDTPAQASPGGRG